ncbi:DUF4350 domain-containing protein [Ornithinimicrobium sp. F0845]|uniref:DUF4350 domain-containing protein n=1 Tax=Ornithinimicrobium sp. F0845 TaxID=2926412 RepID=UPI001FF4D76A|nr:DUF4350 domain-containing protein [Ornithinimicrobium sp. F0845]MCK0113346.1 DUF4350 domain-containing protein [Ornithinimicrobium sp. F0845]
MTARTARRLALWGLLVLLIAVGAAVLNGMRTANQLPFDPDNPEDNGMQALARVLEQEGVDVTVARGLPQLLRTDVSSDTTVLVAGTALIGQDAGQDLMQYAGRAGRLVVLSPEGNSEDVLGLPVEGTSHPQVGAAAPGCEATLVNWRDGDELSHANRLVEVTGARGSALPCFPPTPGYNAGGAQAGFVVELPADGSRPDTVVAGIAGSLTNERILDDANAAAGLRLLGAHPRLVWYVPAVADAGDDAAPQSLMDVLPDAFLPSVWLLALALLATMIWRGRRLGPVVTEPLPAVIRSVETTQSRSRMYRRAEDRERALAALQLAARRRLAVRLGLSAHAQPQQVVRLLAEATGRHTDELHRLLVDPAAPDDETLVRIAREVRSLEEGMIG